MHGWLRGLFSTKFILAVAVLCIVTFFSSAPTLSRSNSTRSVPLTNVYTVPIGNTTTTEIVWNFVKQTTYKGISPEEFSKSLLPLNGNGAIPKFPRFQKNGKSVCCEKWAVVTSIAAPSRTIDQLLSLPSWCVVIVADLETPQQDYEAVGTDRSVFLTVADQQTLPYSLVKALPWNHLGRKNLGYLFAIHHCAKSVYDTDDNSELVPGKAMPSILEGLEFAELQRPFNAEGYGYFNPYPYFEAKSDRKQPTSAWPRGFPLQLIQASQEPPPSGTIGPVKKARNVALIQSLTNLEPDVDALFRLSQPSSLTFNAEKPMVALSKRHYSPLNAQALMVAQHAFFGLLLPITPHDRVTDIWRSNIWQRLLQVIANGQVAFAPAWVERHRKDGANVVAEEPLYTQSEAMVRFLEELKFRASSSIVERVMTVYVALYEVGLLGEKDLVLVRAWLTDLRDVGYIFPAAGLESRTIWQSDLHDGTRIDTPSLLMSLGHYVMNAGHKRNNGPYPEVFEHPHWIATRLAPLITTATGFGNLNEGQLREFFEFYQKDLTMLNTNAFFCSFPMSFCQAYMPFNRSIIFLPAHRYSLARCSTESWQRLTDHLLMASVQKPNGPRHFIAAMGRYDAEYINYFTGLKPLLLSASSFFYTQDVKYLPTKSEILIGPLQLTHVPYQSDLTRVGTLTKREKFTFATAKSLYNRYTLQNVASHRAMVLFPYAVLSYGITEVYAIGIPIFVPSLSFILKLQIVSTRDRRMRDKVYCGPTLVAPPRHPNSSHPYSPEDDSEAATAYWLKYADFYQWPHITLFDSWDDLAVKLDAIDFDHIHLNMVVENERRRMELLENWNWILERIETKSRNIPESYDVAFKELW